MNAEHSKYWVDINEFVFRLNKNFSLCSQDQAIHLRFAWSGVMIHMDLLK